MEKRVVFDGKLLPYALLMPQLFITIVFFYWPAAQAVWQSFFIQDAFGLSMQFVWFENYTVLFANPDYYRSMVTTAMMMLMTYLVTLMTMSLTSSLQRRFRCSSPPIIPIMANSRGLAS